MVRTFEQLICAWPRVVREDGRQLTAIRAFATDCGVKYYHAQMMKFRNSISVDLWPRVLKAAERRGLALSEKDLWRLRENSKAARAEAEKVKAAKAESQGASRAA